MKILRFSSTHTKSETQDRAISDYVKSSAKDQNKIYYLLAENYAAAKSNPHLEQLEKKGIEVIFFTDRIDPWVVEQLPEYEGKIFQDVGRGNIDLADDENKLDQDTINSKHDELIGKMSAVLEGRIEKINISQRLVESAACVVASEQDIPPQMRRMMEASGQQLPEAKPILEINIKHALIQKLSVTKDEQFRSLSNIILDHAFLADGEQLQNPADYVKRMNNLLLGGTNKSSKKTTTKKTSSKKTSSKKKTSKKKTATK
jgi:molecular chaperone HtpG